jgi:hypothetical protein
MQSTLYTRLRLDRIELPLGCTFNETSVPSLPCAPISAQPIQRHLPQPVSDALATLREVLSSAPVKLTSSVTPEIPLPTSREPSQKAPFINSLSRELSALYFQDARSAFPQALSTQWYESLSVLFDHFQHIASLLEPSGYTRCFVAATRNSFADHFHVHDFYTYILYSGREVGTEILVGKLEENALTIEERKDSWQRHTHRIIGATRSPPQTWISDTHMDLLLPPHVAHRACQAQTPQGKVQPNLALALTAFAAVDRKT